MPKHLMGGLLIAGLMQAGAAEWSPLLDMQLSRFEIWMGIPHDSVTGLPEGTPTSPDCHAGVPMGLGNDIKGVFTMLEQGGEPVLHITGEIYGALVTREEFGNYHLSIQAKWGDKKWAPRLDHLRDSGILYHSHGEHGAFWNVWKSSLEFQVQETDLGDFIQIAGPTAQVRVSGIAGTDRPRFDAAGRRYAGGYISAWPEVDRPHGEWNQLELYTVGDTSVHVVNGRIVMVVEGARKQDGSPLTSGQIQLQSEAAEIFFKAMKIRTIEDFPEDIKAQLHLKR